MDLESWLPTDILLFLVFSLAFGLEIVRWFRLRRFHLNLTWTGGWRYAYYLSRLALTAGLGPGLATALTGGVTLLWRHLLSLPSPYNLYTGGLLWLVLAGGVAGLLFIALSKVYATMREVIRPWLFWTALAAICFVFEPLRWIFGGTLVLLVTSAVGRKVRFTGWQDLVDWLRGAPEEAKSAAERLAQRLYRPRRIRIVVLTEAEGYLSYQTGGTEVGGDQAKPDAQPVTLEVAGDQVEPDGKVSRFILNAGRLETLVEAVQRLEERADLLQEIPRVIARNAEKIAEYKKGIEREEGDPEEKKRRVEEFIRREVFEATGFGERMRSLLYWHYGLPEEKVQVSVSRAPRVRLVPLISWAEYFGLFLGKETGGW
ncbi:MAG: hypothetical protein ACP5OO_00905 [Chloroflexia bacterium]